MYIVFVDPGACVCCARRPRCLCIHCDPDGCTLCNPRSQLTPSACVCLATQAVGPYGGLHSAHRILFSGIGIPGAWVRPLSCDPVSSKECVGVTELVVCIACIEVLRNKPWHP